ncbi:hypothetical protein VC83_06472 [Pseudogymnoascus destructans]|uniref:Uncharacterized protein n=2 Tax=Pseudogymnoascus destructans TaxID=655981 RepID=L8FP00_PSED2|nr:uncharacterized protein VC83_06472 [Pseudogymnoascus destructans]ELR02279.1 hypothetical protein GMDG_05348 [Pseudogymnoascus destructans 20631-21]OAF58378.1 hypothetical protein VC83_06472 [Pseudogymnoascus destructans]
MATPAVTSHDSAAIDIQPLEASFSMFDSRPSLDLSFGDFAINRLDPRLSMMSFGGSLSGDDRRSSVGSAPDEPSAQEDNVRHTLLSLDGDNLQNDGRRQSLASIQEEPTQFDENGRNLTPIREDPTPKKDNKQDIAPSASYQPQKEYEHPSVVFIYELPAENYDLDPTPAPTPPQELPAQTNESSRNLRSVYDAVQDDKRQSAASTNENESPTEANGRRISIVSLHKDYVPNDEIRLSVISIHEGDDERPVTQPRETQVPKHPIRSMQAAFEESMLDAFDNDDPPLKPLLGNVAERRRALLGQDISAETHAGKWKQKPGQRYHELWKIMSQISFGIYLLLNGLARDDEQALTILQGHVDEVDGFLETTLEDFDLAQEDIDGRLKNLKLPLENISVFEDMMEDRDFRNQIVSGNETIEHIIMRTAAAMKDSLRNVQQGMEATREVAGYMAQEKARHQWQTKRPEMREVFDAMKGNADGWYKAYVSLQTKGNKLGVALVQLGSIAAEIDKRAGEISRNARFSTAMSPRQSIKPAPITSLPDSPRHSSRPSRASLRSGPSTRSRASMAKELPSNPSLITPAIRATLPAFQLVQEREESPERDSSSVSDPELQEPQFLTLEARTYTPPLFTPPPLAPRAYSNGPPPGSRLPTPPDAQQRVESAPPIARKPSLRERLSLTRKAAPAPLLNIPPHNSTPSPAHTPVLQIRRPPSNMDLRRPPPLHSGATPNSPRSPANPAGLGLDSAYYSNRNRVSVVGTPSQEYHQFIASAQTRHDYGSTYVTTPRSEQQHFHPVQASPHSPLQRPWTAAPTQRLPPGGSSGVTSARYNSYGSSYGNSNYSAGGGRESRMNGSGSVYPSNMSRVTLASQVTVGVDEQGKKVKKKRSGFGWLKKAFSLSEEEKREFEEARRGRDVVEKEGRRERIFLDGKRVNR